MITWNQLASNEAIKTTADALTTNGITVIVVETGAEAYTKALELIPKGAEVMNMSSVTVDTIGLGKAINESGNFNSVRNTLTKMTAEADRLQKQKLGAGPEWAVGSAHVVTQDGKVMVASQSGSQLPAYASGASHVLWVVGAQKIVADLNAAWQRLTEYVLPLESKRARIAYNIPADKPGSAINKLFILNKEIKPNRITMIIVKEVLGF